MFIGRERELQELNDLYQQNRFHLFILYGRRRVGKTTFLKHFCEDKEHIFYSAEQSNEKMNLQKFSRMVFEHYGESSLEAFSSWENAITFIDERQADRPLVLVFDEFPYLAAGSRALLSGLQHLIDHRLQAGKLFLVLCGSYMGFMEKEVLGAKSPLFGRRTGQLHMKTFSYRTSFQFMDGFSTEEKFELYGAVGGTAMYLNQIRGGRPVRDMITDLFLKPAGYLYEEPGLLLRQELQEPSVYSSVIEAIASGASRAGEIAGKCGEDTAKCLKYIRVLIELGILYKEVPFGEKLTSRKTIYGISDLMFRFWYRYVAANKTLLETGAPEIVWQRRIEPDYSHYMGMVFERTCREYLLEKNAKGALPVLFSQIGRWWGTDARTRKQTEIDLIAGDRKEYLICECKWRRELLDYPVLEQLRYKADVFCADREKTWFVLFSKSGFTRKVLREAAQKEDIILVTLEDMIND